LVTACGSPFSAKIGPPDADTDNSPDRGDRDMGHTDARGDRTDSSPDHKDSAPDHTDRKDGGQLVDGGHKDVVFPDVAPWDSPVGDVHADGSPRDVVSSWDTGPVDTGCTPLTSTFQTGWCYSPGITTPGAYCVTSTSTGQHAGTTPAECQCAATFTCACLVAAGDPCDGHGVFTSCTDGGGMGPDVICS
jgi:hypothetical protein